MRTLVAFFVMTLFVTLPAARAEHDPAVHRETIEVNGEHREYLLYLPPNPGRVHVPLLIALHGGSMTARQLERPSGLTQLAHDRDFAVVYPQGKGNHWNDGRLPPDGKPLSTADDVAFVRVLLQHLEQTAYVDPKRVVVTGPSNGGMMTLRLACEAPELFAAVMLVIASLPVDERPRCKMDPDRLSVVMINGTDDPLVPYNGGQVMAWRRPAGAVFSAPETFRLFAARSGCSGAPEQTTLRSSSPGDPTSVLRETYLGCRDDATAVLYTINGGGHRWPGSGPIGLLGRLLGDSLGARSTVIDASTLAAELVAKSASVRVPRSRLSFSAEPVSGDAQRPQ